jgi:hypothetical protein
MNYTMPQISISVSHAEKKRLEKIRDDTGLPISKIIELERRGYRLSRST